MIKDIISSTTILCTVLSFSITSSPPLFADEGSEHLARDQEVTNSNTEIDPRLPPTIPGQEMIVGGKKVKVTSTAGPIPVSPAPEPWKDQHSDTLRDIVGNGGVIVDDRSRGNRR